MRTDLSDSPKRRKLAAGIATPVVALGLYVELARKATPEMLDHVGYSHERTAGTATVAALYETEGGYTATPPNRPVNHRGGAIEWRAIF